MSRIVRLPGWSSRGWRRLLQRLARAAGFEIIRAAPERPLFWIPEVELMQDPSVGGWRTGVLHLANRHRRPSRLGKYEGGGARRLDYVTWFLDVRDARVLELGPLEGFYSVILDKLGVRSAVAVEARPENLEKCRRVRELYRLDRTEFVRHDVEALARGDEQPSFSGPFDLVFSLGLLYHLRDPVRALRWTASQAPALFLGTHYVERADPRWYPDRLFSEGELESGGERYAGKRFVESPDSPAGGLSDHAFWLDEESLTRALRSAGYTTVSVIGKDLLSDFPHITILSERS
jgi:Methyltransferase domain